MTHRLSLKPIFALVACFAIALALVGCSSDNSTQEENTSESTSSENVTLEIYAANSLEKALDEVQELTLLKILQLPLPIPNMKHQAP